MKLRLFSSVLSLCAAGFSLLAFNSCKEDTILGANLVSAGDTAFVAQIPDTLTVYTKTVRTDSFVTSNSISGLPIYHALGTVIDPYSGKTNAGFYFQLVPPSLGYGFPKTPDSAVLILPYSGFTWGDTTASNTGIQIKVYEVAGTDSIPKSDTFYNFSKTAVDPNPIGTAAIGFNHAANHQSVKDSVNVLGVNRPPHIRIKLSQDFLNKFINASGGGTAFAGYAEFLNFQRGLYIEADSNAGNALYYFALNGTNDFTRANVQFYYTEQNSSGNDTVNYASFYFDQTRNGHYNRITRNYSGTPTGSLLASPAVSDSIVVLQNEPGAAIDLFIPHIKDLLDQPRPIAKAELVITQVKLPGDQANIYFPPSRIFPVRITETGKKESVQDRYPLSSSEPLVFMSGLAKTVSIDGSDYNQYVINLPREIQKALTDKKDMLHLRISGAETFPAAYRLIAGGRNYADSRFRVQLRIYYSKI